MRIDAYNKVEGIYNNSKIKNVKVAQDSAKKDSIEISDAGRAYQVAKDALATTPDVRQDRIDDIKNRITSGTYNIDSEEVASYIVDKFFDAEV